MTQWLRVDILLFRSQSGTWSSLADCCRKWKDFSPFANCGYQFRKMSWRGVWYVDADLDVSPYTKL